MMPVFNVYTH